MPAPTPAIPPLTEFASFYLYGLSPNPYLQSTDLEKFGQLYSLVVGNHGGVSLSSSLHPYQLVSEAGLTVWYTAYAQLYAQPDRAALFEAMTDEQARYVVAPPASFAEFHVWPDTRLTSVENPVFSHYIPFVLPFLVRKGPAALRWDAEFAAAEGDAARLQPYLKAVTEAIRFVQPAPAFVLGFGEFDEQQPERLIEEFMSCRDLLLTR
ncbi:hypothetical protein E4631_16905 [Hymenobacter sp. UV11]|uniref:hypothetical protein n=1 Tax=Hymenobacter sp. UV11 TaxID=1849735 RepID=UPI0010615CD5|nr:hypothetical protein [Hymenobacter sp. UV11]TDN37997.1 hypothetical protein A8B98_01720 [Hymenobacter sp. UV11]TFZ65210.1 hypothetical protein E4631_16905 [Hymenobacter sp. UV11]